MHAEYAALALLGFMFLLPMNWKQCVKLVMYLLVVEGAIRKWILPGASEIVYFVKDGVILLSYFKYLYSPERAESRRDESRGIKFLICVASFIPILQAFNPYLNGIPVGIIGARNYVMYIPLMFLMKDLFRSQDELNRFLRRYLLLALPVCFLAIVQYLSPPGSWINAYTNVIDPSQRAMIGGAVRVTATFSYIAGYAAYLQTCAALTIPLLLVFQPRAWRLALLAVMVAIVVGMLLTGSRGPVLGLGLLLIGYFALNRTFRALGLYKKFIVPSILAALAISVGLGAAFVTYLDRFSANADLFFRVTSAFTVPFAFIDVSGILGYGAGATYQAGPIIRSLLGLGPGPKISALFESEPERIMLELGPLGFGIWYVMKITILTLLWKTYRQVKLPLLRELALTAFLVQLIALPGQMVFQVTFMVYYWFLSGFIFLLPAIERRDSNEEAS